ncbi:hypothetical protein [Klebsiella aerogenes]|uniref:hypothetical protein n=1 Tax=Klebsiella TaxID=570 RepID=UPI002B1BE1CD|nr:hypothetical protein [Klebsiella aerogenes]
MRLFPSYPIFLWITWCKILFIVSDQFWKTRFHCFHKRKSGIKNIYKSSHWYSYP